MPEAIDAPVQGPDRLNWALLALGCRIRAVRLTSTSTVPDTIHEPPMPARDIMAAISPLPRKPPTCMDKDIKLSMLARLSEGTDPLISPFSKISETPSRR